MSDSLTNSLVTVATAIVGVATLSVIVGGRNTAGVITAGGNAFSQALNAATAPATGGSGLGSGGLSFPSVNNMAYA
jgi:hypothetical protein